MIENVFKGRGRARVGGGPLWGKGRKVATSSVPDCLLQWSTLQRNLLLQRETLFLLLRLTPLLRKRILLLSMSLDFLIWTIHEERCSVLCHAVFSARWSSTLEPVILMASCRMQLGQALHFFLGLYSRRCLFCFDSLLDTMSRFPKCFMKL